MINQGSTLDDSESLEAVITNTLQVASRSLNVCGDISFAFACALGTPPVNKRGLSSVIGRAAAQKALKGLGFAEPPPIPRGRAGEPIWPDGVSGSITHCYPWSVAVTTRCSDRFTLGIDLESIERTGKVDVSAVICSKSERDWVLASQNSDERLCMMFSAKESLFKSLYPSYRRYIDFEEAELSWCRKYSAFRAVLPAAEYQEKQFISCIPSQRCGRLIFSCALYKAHSVRQK